jgi:tetratricopeptide (TPR) repeat protein
MIDDRQNDKEEPGQAAFERAQQYHHDGVYDLAIAEYSAAIEEAPDEGKYYYGRGASHHINGEGDAALEDFGKAMERGCLYPYNERGCLYIERKEYQKAVDDFDRALEFCPAEWHPKIYANRGLAYFELYNYDKAIADYKAAGDLDGGFSDWYLYKIGRAYYLKGEYAEALEYFDKAIELKPEDVSYYKERETVHRAMGDLDAAGYDEFRANLLSMIELGRQHEPGYEKAPIEKEGPYYDIIKNNDGEILVCIKAREGESEDPELFYAGGAEAIFYRRSGQYILLDQVRMDVRAYLAAAREVLMVEVASEDAYYKPLEMKKRIREYKVPVHYTEEPPGGSGTESSAKLLGDCYPLFKKLYDRVKAHPKTPLAELIDLNDLVNLFAVAARNEDYELLERCINETWPDGKGGVNLNCCVSPVFKSWRPTPLYYITTSAVWGSMQSPEAMLKYLVEHGADPDAIAFDGGSTPLGNICLPGGDAVRMKALLDLGADPNHPSMEDGYAYTPLNQLLRPSHDGSANRLGWIPLTETQTGMAAMLLEYGADPNSDMYILTPLVQVFTYGEGPHCTELIKLLIKKGANIDAAIKAMEDHIQEDEAQETEDAGAQEAKALFLYALYRLYSAGEFIPQDKEKAAGFLARAADFGYQPAVAELGSGQYHGEE